MAIQIQDIREKLKRARENSETGGNVSEYECADCKDTTFLVRKNEDGYDEAVPCKCREKRLAQMRMKASGLSDDDLNKGFADFLTFEEPPLIEAKATARRYYSSFDSIQRERANSIILCGAVGRGKTTLGLAIVNNLIHKGISVLYMPYRDTITSLKQTIIDEMFYKEKMNRLKNVAVLFIDDLFKGKITDSDINIIYEIVNHRYLNRLPVITSTEKTQNELLEIDEAIGSRLIEMSKGYIVTFDKSTPNYRLR